MDDSMVENNIVYGSRMIDLGNRTLNAMKLHRTQTEQHQTQMNNF